MLALRESPYSLVHIENMRRATLAGAIVAPPLPAFYIDAPSVERFLDAYCVRAARLLGLSPRGRPVPVDGSRRRLGRAPPPAAVSARPGVLRSLRTTLEMIKFSHTLFALPFALLAAFLAAGGWPRRPTLVKILLAMVGARSAAMAHNRLADRAARRAPTRARRRAPFPRAPSRSASCACSSPPRSALFVAAAASLNRLTLLLSPGRAGAARSLLLHEAVHGAVPPRPRPLPGPRARRAPGSPCAGRRDALPILLGLAVLFWTAGFDVHLLAPGRGTRPERRPEVDSGALRRPAGALDLGAHFTPSWLVLLAAVWRLSGGGWIFLAGLAATAAALVYQHAIVQPGRPLPRGRGVFHGQRLRLGHARAVRNRRRADA